MEHLYIRMFGEFSLRAGDVYIVDYNNRSKKVWTLLAYLITHRSQVVTRRELLELLWKEDSAGANPENSLKAILFRARALLNQLWPSAGHQLIIHTSKGYKWNTEIAMTIDTEEFERLCRKSCETEEERIGNLANAMAVYRGECLGDFTSEPWAFSMTVYFHNLYIQSVLEVIPLLAVRERHEDVAEACKAALEVEIYHEPLHQYLMQALLAQGDYRGTAAVYENLTEKMFRELGIRPQAETVALYRKALQSERKEHLSIEDVMEYLNESQVDGAFECDYDYFRVLSHAEARSVRHGGTMSHIVLWSIQGVGGKELSKRSVERAMENLGGQIGQTLRQSDIFSKCSITQYVALLPETDEEGSCALGRQVIKNYMRRYPNSPISIQFVVRPLVSEI